MGVRILVLRDDTTKDELAGILNGEYNILYVTPEKTLAKKGAFVDIVKKSDRFKNRVIALIFDEAHCIMDWGSSFRPEYANVPNIRVFLPGVPVAALSATLTPEAFLQLGNVLKVKADNALLLRESSNRANVFYGVAQITRGCTETFEDLSFLIPGDIGGDCTEETLAIRIPLTIIYGNAKHIIDDLATYLQSLLPRHWLIRPHGPHRKGDDIRSIAERTISIYHSTLSDTLKAMTEADVQSKRCRILCASSAYGMGVDNKYVHRVIQWKVAQLNSVEDLVQRWGRAGRDPHIQGIGMIFVEQTYFGPLPSRPLPPTSEVADKRSSKRKTPTQPIVDAPAKKVQRGDCRMNLQPALYNLINLPDESVRCRRAVIMDHYEDPLRLTSGPYATGPCCDQHLGAGTQVRQFPCGQGLNLWPKIQQSSFGYGARQWAKSTALMKENAKSAIQLWRDKTYQRDWKDDPWATKQAVLTDKQIDILTRYCTRFPVPEDLLIVKGFTWDKSLFNRYAKDLCRSVNKALNFKETCIEDDIGTTPLANNSSEGLLVNQLNTPAGILRAIPHNDWTEFALGAS